MGAQAGANSDVPDRATDGPETEALGQRELTSLLFVAAQTCGLQEKELAFLLGYDGPYLSRIKNGEKPLPAARLARLPLEVRQVLWTLAAQEDGLIVSPDDVRRRVIGRLLIALGEAIAVFSETEPRGTKRMVRCA
jgi:hypothetical protein